MNIPSHQVNLFSLLAGMAELDGRDDCVISGLAIDSRKITSGDLFIALAGTQCDGNDFIESAIQQGAAAIVYDINSKLPASITIENTNAVFIPLADISTQAGVIASRYYGKPSNKLVITGITGTNGKTTCSILLAQCLQALNVRTGVMGTLGTGLWGEMEKSTHTTLDALTLQKQMSEMVINGAKHLVMEVSSHGLQQLRVSGTDFDAVIFTNLTQDHLDYHGSMQNYGEEKAKLFFQHAARLAVINSDDAFGKSLLNGPLKAKQVLTYGLNSGDVRATKIQLHATGIKLSIDSPFGQMDLNSPLMGRFNVYNLLACATLLLASGYEVDAVARGLSSAKSAVGRMEVVVLHGVTVVIDFAHTPDALKQALQALRSHQSEQKLICVFGCGGDRDHGKRPQMGVIAEQFSDTVIVTDDNPRNENPDDIRAQIVRGMQGSPLDIGNRRQAIKQACEMAEAGDILLIAGKGHETTQQVGDLSIPFNDREVVVELMSAIEKEKGVSL